MRYFFASYTCGHNNSGRGSMALKCSAFPPAKLLVDQAVKSSSEPASTVSIRSLFEFKSAEDFNSFNSGSYEQVKK